MADYLGIRPASSTVRFTFSTHAASGAPVAPNSAFENSDLRIYKDGSATQRSSAAGITMTSPFDSVTGSHHVDIDLSDNTHAGFYAAGSFYEVHLVPDETVDSLAVFKVLIYFDIGVPVANVTQIMAEALSATGKNPFFGIIDRGTAQSATSTTLVFRSAAAFTDDQVIGATLVITGGTAGAGESRVIRDYVSSTDTATVDAWTTTPTGTITYEVYGSPPNTSITQTGDAYAIANSGTFGNSALKTLIDALDDVQTGDAYAVVTSGTYGNAALRTLINTLDTVVDTVVSRLPTALVSGRMDASVGAMAASVLTATAIASDAITDAKVASDVTIASVTGAVGSVTGAVGSVTGNVTGSIGSLAAQAKADVNGEVLDVLVTDTFAEPSVVHAATASLKDKIGWQAVLARNTITQTATTQLVRNDADDGTIATSTVSDDGTTAIRGEFA